MIKMIAGAFGWTGDGPLETITAQSGPRSFPPEVEARLVRMGVAEYASGAEQKAETPNQTPVKPDQDAPIAYQKPPHAAQFDLPGMPAYSEDMTKAQLAAVMDEAGIFHTDSMTKAAMLQKLDEYYRG